MIKKILVVAIVIFTFMLPTSFGEIIYGKSTEERINSGTLYKNFLLLDGKTWRNINVVEIDLTDEDTALKIIKSDSGIKNRLRLKGNIDDNQSIVAAINGDFFDTSTKAVLGPLIENGDIYTSHINEKGFTNIVVSGESAEIVDNFILNMRFINRESKKSLPVFYVNKPFYNQDTMVYYDRFYDDKSPGYTGKRDVIEYVVKNDVIIEIRYNKGSVTIPEDGYVIAAVGRYMEQLTSNFAVGNEADFVYNSSPSVNLVDMVFGSGAVILKDGKVPETFDMNIRGNHPRTAVGISKDKKILYLVTIDGRDRSFTGVSQEYLGELLKYIGAYDGVNLDGGGSTEMVVKFPGMFKSDIVNVPSDGSERLLVNGIGVVNKGNPGMINGINIEMEDTSIFVDSRRKINIKAYDINYNPLIIEDYKINWKIEGVEGKFEDGYFLPSTVGKGKITAKYDGFEKSVDIYVVDNIKEIITRPSVLSGDYQDRVKFETFIKNTKGYTSSVIVSDLDWDIPEGIGHFDEEGYFVIDSKDSKGEIKVSFKGVKKKIPYVVGHEELIIDKFEEKDYSFDKFPANMSGNIEIVKEGFDKNGLKLSYDFKNKASTRASYVLFDKELKLDRIPDKLGLMVKGDHGNNHWLRGIIEDENNNSYYVDFHENVDWEGWSYITGKIPKVSGESITIKKIYVVETDENMTDQGYIILDNLIGIYYKDYQIENRKYENPLKNKFKKTSGKGLVFGNNYEKADVALDTINQNTQLMEFDNTIIHGVDASKGSIIKTNPYQLKKILSYFTQNSENIVISFNGSFPGSDREEVKLIFDSVKNNVDLDNREVWFIYRSSGDSYEYDMKNGIFMVGIPDEKSIKLNISDEGLFLEKIVE